MPNYKKIDLSKLNDIEIYELLLEGTITSFPSGFWVNKSKEEGKEVSVKLLRYLIIDRLKLSKEDIKQTISKKLITQNKLHTPCKLYHSRSAIQFVLNAIPELELSLWQFKEDKVPYGFWTKEENRVSALRNFFEVQMRWSIEDVKERLSWEVLEENGLGTLHTYYPSLCKILKAAYNVDIDPWEIINSEVPSGTWEDRRNRIQAINWLLNKEKFNTSNIDRKTFSKYGLSKLLTEYYCDNVSKAVKEVLKVRCYGKSGTEIMAK
jgi:hypothetical protein